MKTSLFGTAILAASLALALGTARAGNFQRQVAADAHGQVEISNIAGSITVNAWDEPAVSVTADLPSATQRVKVTGGHGRTSVCVTYGHGCGSAGSGGKRPVRLEVRVPRGSELDVSGVSANVTSSGVTGRQHLHTVSGDIHAALGSGNDEVNSVSGDIDLDGGAEDGTLHVTSVSGDLTVTHVAGELEARTVNGKVTAELPSARLVRIHTTSSSIELHAALASGGTVETETVSGAQKLRLAAPAGYRYEAKSFSGDITDCFGQEPSKSGYGPGSRLSGTRGGGAGHVRVKSLSGDISLCDH
jgi:hypothetical protein